MTFKIHTKWPTFFQWAFVLIMPVLFFPILSVFSLIFDWFIGDAGSVLQILHGPKKQFLYDYLIDWRDSLLLSAIFIWLVFMPIYHFIKNKVTSKKKHLFISGILVWIVIGVYLYQFNPIGILLIGLSGLFIQSVFFLLQSKPACT